MENIKEDRPSWDEYFMNIVDAVAKRASCNRGKSGSVIVKNNRILTTGYVGAPSGSKDCYEEGHLLQEVIYKNGEVKQHCIRTIHAEQNAITQAAKYGIAINNSTLYCTMEPCFNCAKLIVASGIIRVVAKYSYQAVDNTRNLFKQANIELKLLNNKVLNYDENK